MSEISSEALAVAAGLFGTSGVAWLAIKRYIVFSDDRARHELTMQEKQAEHERQLEILRAEQSSRVAEQVARTAETMRAIQDVQSEMMSSITSIAGRLDTNCSNCEIVRTIGQMGDVLSEIPGRIDAGNQEVVLMARETHARLDELIRERRS